LSVSIGAPRGIGVASCHFIARPQPAFQVPRLIPNQVMKQLLGSSRAKQAIIGQPPRK